MKTICRYESSEKYICFCRFATKSYVAASVFQELFKFSAWIFREIVTLQYPARAVTCKSIDEYLSKSHPDTGIVKLSCLNVDATHAMSDTTKPNARKVILSNYRYMVHGISKHNCARKTAYRGVN